MKLEGKFETMLDFGGKSFGEVTGTRKVAVQF